MKGLSISSIGVMGALVISVAGRLSPNTPGLSVMKRNRPEVDTGLENELWAGAQGAGVTKSATQVAPWKVPVSLGTQPSEWSVRARQA